MSPLREMLEKLLERGNLDESQAEDLLTRLTNPEEHQAMSGALLAALRSKGVVAEELRGFARAMRKLMLLDARGVISVTERQSYILRVRELAKACGAAWLATEAGGRIAA